MEFELFVWRKLTIRFCLLLYCSLYQCDFVAMNFEMKESHARDTEVTGILLLLLLMQIKKHAIQGYEYSRYKNKTTCELLHTNTGKNCIVIYEMNLPKL